MQIAVILSGCGYLDGAEIRESVCTLLHLDHHACDVSIFAPDRDQMHVVDHLSSQETGESRNILTEAARIARGDIAPLEALKVESYDALILPGGFGVAKNLCDFALKGKDMTADALCEEIIHAFYQASKPIGAICIAPVLLAYCLKGEGIDLTIGEDADTAAFITSLGHTHHITPTDEAVIDHKHRIASCSAYMRDDASISDVSSGIAKVVEAVISMAKQQKEYAA